jgi:hypothetical protein
MDVESGGQRADDDELRRMVQDVGMHGWDSDCGPRLLAVVEEHCRGWAIALDRHCGLDYGTVDPRDLVTEVWFVLNSYPQSVINAEAPWAYLWNAVRNATSVAAAGAAIGSMALAERDMAMCRKIPLPVRVGAETWRLDRAIIPDTDGQNSGYRWSRALRCFLELLVERGGDRRFWADAIDRAVEVMADARRSYEERDLRRDPYLRLVLELRPEQLSALGALLIGTRRGNRAQQSLLLALHRNPSAGVEEVPGAADRINLLIDLQRLAESQAPSELEHAAVGTEREAWCPARAPAAPLATAGDRVRIPNGAKRPSRSSRPTASVAIAPGFVQLPPRV